MYFELGTGTAGTAFQTPTIMALESTGMVVTGTLSATGTISATGGNSGNWNTAYTVANAALPKAGGTLTGGLSGTTAIFSGTANFATDRIRALNYSGGTGLATQGELMIRSAGKTGWAVGDELGKISFYQTDASGNLPGYQASIRAVNESGNGSTTTISSAALHFYTSAYNNAESYAGKISIANVWDSVGGFAVNGTEVIDASRNITAASRLTFSYQSHYFEATPNNISWVSSAGSVRGTIGNLGFDTTLGYRIAGVQVINASRNITSGTIESGTITSSGIITATVGNSTQWNTAYTYSQVGHLPLVGGTLTGGLSGTTATFSGALSSGAITITRASDGSLVEFKRGTAVVGTIGVAASDNIYFAGESGSTKGIYINNAAVYPANTGGNVIDNAVDLGQSGTRWKNLYLSGVSTAGSYKVGTTEVINASREIDNVPRIFFNGGLQAIDLNNADSLIFDTPDGHSALLLSGGSYDTNYHSNETHYFRGTDLLDIHAIIDTTGIKSFGDYKVGSTAVIDASRQLINIAKITGNSATGGTTTFNVGRGDVYFENNVNSNASGAGITLRTSANPAGDGSIFDVRSSGQATRLYVGQDLTSSGYNPFYVGNSNSTGGNGTASNYAIELAVNGNITTAGTISSGAITSTATLKISGSHSSTITTPNINSFGALSAGTAYNYHIMFKQADGTVRGQITNNIYGTQYTTSSDYRLKENVQPLSSSTSRTLALNPCTFEWIDDADNNSIEGFLAHEVAAIVPEAVVGTKDALDADGNPEYQTIDQSKLIPILVKTIQELEARITALESA